MRLGKKLADSSQHQLYFSNQLQLSAGHYKFGDNNNNELLIINLASVRAGRISNTSSSPSLVRKLQLKTFMFKFTFFLTLLFLTGSYAFGQQLSSEDYKVYAAVIKTEISDSTKSVAIIRSGIDSQETTKNTYSTADNLTSKDLSYKYQTYNWTENYKKERPSIIDSNSAQLLVDYCKSRADKFTLTNDFKQTFRTVLIKKFPIRRKSIQQDWTNFYEKYPVSGGIFSFAKIKYYTEDKTTAIFYYWVRRNGLNGHGALAVMTKISGEWQMKYKTYLWWN